MLLNILYVCVCVLYVCRPPGICVADPVRVSVSQPVSIDVPLPYKLVRGEQLELQGSVYNQELNSLKVSGVTFILRRLCLY